MSGIVRNQRSAYRDTDLTIRQDNMLQRDYRMILRGSNRVVRSGRLTFGGISAPLIPLVPTRDDRPNYKFLRRRRRI